MEEVRKGKGNKVFNDCITTQYGDYGYKPII
jgi:hypothetical protein